MNISVPDIIKNSENLYDGDLRYYFKKVFSAPNVFNPYHNFRHMIHMTFETYEAAKSFDYPDKNGKKSFRALLIAAIFHDFDHSGKMGNDAREIKRASKSLETLILDKDRESLPEIKSLISATEFPHKQEVASLGAEILRDADMGQSFSDVWLQNIVFGLAEERNVSPIEILESQIGFLKNLRFYTSWGKNKFEKKIPSRIAEVEKYLEILK